MATAQSEQPAKQILQDPFRMCRLCFQTPGVHDVSIAPAYLQAIKNLHNIIVSAFIFSKSIIYCDVFIHLFCVCMLFFCFVLGCGPSGISDEFVDTRTHTRTRTHNAFVWGGHYTVNMCRFNRRTNTRNRCAKNALNRLRSSPCIKNWWKLANTSSQSVSKCSSR